MDTDTLLSELNLDNTAENQTVAKNLIDESEEIIIHSVDSNVSKTMFENNLIFKRAVKTLATDLYYNRTLPNGLSLGTQMMINNLKGVDFSGTSTE